MNAKYNSGTANKVNTVEKAKPQTMLAATGPHNRLSPPMPKAKENRPPMVVVVVMMMGTTRRREA
jgi:hypothetical protein